MHRPEVRELLDTMKREGASDEVIAERSMAMFEKLMEQERGLVAMEA